MPAETPFGPPESLVGRTFERGGLRRHVTSITGYINWQRTRKSGMVLVGRTCMKTFIRWLSGATEVHDGQG